MPKTRKENVNVYATMVIEQTNKKTSGLLQLQNPGDNFFLVRKMWSDIISLYDKTSRDKKITNLRKR